jgi:hypothetical protein
MTDAPSTLPAPPARRWSDVLWSSGLVLAVLGLLVASFGGAGVLARLFGMAGVGLGLGGAALAFRRGAPAQC